MSGIDFPIVNRIDGGDGFFGRRRRRQVALCRGLGALADGEDRFAVRDRVVGAVIGEIRLCSPGQRFEWLWPFAAAGGEQAIEHGRERGRVNALFATLLIKPAGVDVIRPCCSSVSTERNDNSSASGSRRSMIRSSRAANPFVVDDGQRVLSPPFRLANAIAVVAVGLLLGDELQRGLAAEAIAVGDFPVDRRSAGFLASPGQHRS